MNINAGDLLVASPEMDDEYFTDSVILITLLNKQAVVGFIINKPTTMPAGELFDNLDDCYKTFKRRYFVGGPVEETYLNSLTLSDFGGYEVIPGIRMGGRFDNIWELLNSDEYENRLILGYTGWGVQQLQREISDGSWLVYKNIAIDKIFDEIDNQNMLTSQSAIAVLREYAKT